MKEIKRSTLIWYATLIFISIILLETFLIRMIYLREAEKFNNSVKSALIECDRKLEKYYSSYFILNTKDSTTFSHKANKDFNFDFQYIGSTNVAKSYENKGLDRSTNINLKKIVSTLNNIVVIDKEVNRNVQTNVSLQEFILILLKSKKEISKKPKNEIPIDPDKKKKRQIKKYERKTRVNENNEKEQYIEQIVYIDFKEYFNHNIQLIEQAHKDLNQLITTNSILQNSEAIKRDNKDLSTKFSNLQTEFQQETTINEIQILLKNIYKNVTNLLQKDKENLNTIYDCINEFKELIPSEENYKKKIEGFNKRINIIEYLNSLKILQKYFGSQINFFKEAHKPKTNEEQKENRVSSLFT
jgi:hypothetical protein